ncbi:MAG TPA: hypothetical protein VJ727_02115 [Rhodanobacteraceae bacterium]|nr:hypothetical protein [Rhodanobacteraceae bacterium]
MNPRLTLSLGKACVAGAAVVFAIGVLEAIFLSIVGSRTWDLAGGRTVSLNFLKGFALPCMSRRANTGCSSARSVSRPRITIKDQVHFPQPAPKFALDLIRA